MSSAIFPPTERSTATLESQAVKPRGAWMSALGPSLWQIFMEHDWLVVLAILKNMKVNGKYYPIYYGK